MHTNILFKSIVLGIALCVPAWIHAAEITLYPSQSRIGVGDFFSVDVLVHSDEDLNAAAGTITYPTDLLTVREIRDGNSVIDFWVEKSNDFGSVSFSGIAPGGFKGTNQKLISINFEATASGMAEINAPGFSLLRADGVGTAAAIETQPLILPIAEGEGPATVTSVRDVEQPEDFTPSIVADPALFDGQLYLVFATQDKGVGMSHFEIKEGVFAFYKQAESPYLIKNQNLTKDIYVKAVDLNGNERVAVVPAQHAQEVSLPRIILGSIILLIAVLLLVRKKWFRHDTR